MRLTAFAVAVLLLTAPAGAATLYVNGSQGNDAVPRSANSASTPWRSIARAAWGSTDRNAPNPSEAAQPGDTVVIAAGVYDAAATGRARNVPLYNPANSGSAGQPITFRASGTVEVRSSVYRGPVIGTYERSHIVWDGFLIDETHTNSVPDTGPVVIWASESVTVQNLEVKGTFVPYVDNHPGIRVEASNRSIVRNNLIYGLGILRNGRQDRHQNSAGIQLYDSNHTIIEHNEIHTCGAGVFVKAIKLALGQDGTIIRYNLFRDMGRATLSRGAGVILQSSTNARVYQNVFRNTDFGVEFQASSRPQERSIDDIVANNTFHNIGRAAFSLQGTLGSWTNVRVHNNILTGVPLAVYAETLDAPGDLDFAHNVYFDAGSEAFARLRDARHSFDGWRKKFGKDDGRAASVQIDPRYVDASSNDLRLCTAARAPATTCKAASAVLNTGIDLLDLDGDGSDSDSIAPGAYVSGTEQIGRIKSTDKPIRP